MSLATEEAKIHPEDMGFDPKGEKFSPTIAALNPSIKGIALSDLLISILEVVGTFKLLHTFVTIPPIADPKAVVVGGATGDPVIILDMTEEIGIEPPIDA